MHSVGALGLLHGSSLMQCPHPIEHAYAHADQVQQLRIVRRWTSDEKQHEEETTQQHKTRETETERERERERERESARLTIACLYLCCLSCICLRACVICAIRMMRGDSSTQEHGECEGSEESRERPFRHGGRRPHAVMLQVRGTNIHMTWGYDMTPRDKHPACTCTCACCPDQYTCPCTCPIPSLPSTPQCFKQRDTCHPDSGTHVIQQLLMWVSMHTDSYR